MTDQEIIDDLFVKKDYFKGLRDKHKAKEQLSDSLPPFYNMDGLGKMKTFPIDKEKLFELTYGVKNETKNRTT